MNKKIILIAAITALITSCGNKTEEVKNPFTGTILKQYEYYEDENGQKVKDGEFKSWNSDGSLEYKANFNDGVLDGEEIFYMSPDLVKYTNYEDGIKTGDYRIEKNGVVVKKATYKQDELDGPVFYYYPNGKIKAEGYEKMGEPDKEWKYYDLSGKVIADFKIAENRKYPVDLIGRWDYQNKKGDDEIYFLFDKDWKAYLFTPLFKIQKEAAEEPIFRGTYSFQDYLYIKNAMRSLEYEIIYFDGKILKIKDMDNGEIEVYKKSKQPYKPYKERERGNTGL